MVGISKKTPEEHRENEEKLRGYYKEYNARPEVIERHKKYYKEYSKLEGVKESHREAQARYRRTAKGRACDERYWKNRKTKPN